MNVLTAPPSEENLLQNTLWPETEKLYAHGNELFTLATSPDGLLLASACRVGNTDNITCNFNSFFHLNL